MTFFRDVGVHLLKDISRADRDVEIGRREIAVESDWSLHRFSEVASRIRTHDFRNRHSREKLEDLSRFLSGERDFILMLLENQNLLEHETFSELLSAVSHLAVE